MVAVASRLMVTLFGICTSSFDNCIACLSVGGGEGDGYCRVPLCKSWYFGSNDLIFSESKIRANFIHLRIWLRMSVFHFYEPHPWLSTKFIHFLAVIFYNYLSSQFPTLTSVHCIVCDHSVLCTGMHWQTYELCLGSQMYTTSSVGHKGLLQCVSRGTQIQPTFHHWRV